MKKVLPFLFIYILFYGCKPESDVSPANAGTFVRYFGSEYSHDAVLALEAFDGYTLVSTVNIPTDNLGSYLFKIRFIHTDLDGNIVWHKEYPSFDEIDVADVQGGAPTGGFKASSFIVLESGYLIVGDRINGSGSSDLVLIETDKNGEQVNIRFMSPGTSLIAESLHGRAVMADESNYVVLGSIESSGSNSQMFLTKLSGDYDSLWSYRYVDGENKLMNRIFYSADKTELVWASSVVLTSNEPSQSDLRLIRAPEDSQGTNSSNPFGEPSFNEIGADVCQAFNGYAIVGTSQSSTGGAEDIFLSLVSPVGTQRKEPVIFSMNANETDLNDEGNSVNETSEGGLVILGTSESGERGNGRKDLYLIKTDASGNEQWSNNFGGPEDEQGASAFETSDGSYLIFGTTAFGSLQKLILIKTNNKGQL